MRSQLQIAIEKEKLKRLRKELPEFSFFGDNNWLLIDTQLDVLDGILDSEDEIYEKEEELGESGVNGAIEALQWLEGDSEILVEDITLTEEEIKKIESELERKSNWKKEFDRKEKIRKKRQATLKAKSPLEQFRTRWKRWLMQKCRIDRPHWVELLDSNWVGWADKVYHKHSLKYSPLGPFAPREIVIHHYMQAIEVATMEEFRKLDDMYCWDKVEKRNR